MEPVGLRICFESTELLFLEIRQSQFFFWIFMETVHRAPQEFNLRFDISKFLRNITFNCRAWIDHRI